VSCLLALCLTSLACEQGADQVAPIEPPRPENIDEIDVGVANAIRNTLVLIEREPDNNQHWAALGMLYHANELYGAAEATYAHLAERTPDEPRAWYFLAIVRDSLGRPDEALEAMSRAIELEESYAPSHWRRGEWWLDRGDLAAAEADFERAIALAPADPAARQGMARVFLERGEGARAAELLESVVAADPEDPYGHLLLGNAYRQLGRMEEAATELQQGQGERIVRSDPWAAEIQRFRLSFGARTQAAADYLAQGRPDLAVPIFEQLRIEDPDDVRVLTKLGLGYLKQQRVEDSLATLRDALERHPEHFNVHLQLASALQMSGDSAGALAHVQRAIDLKPEYALSHARHAAILEKLQRWDEAATAYGTALLHSPGDPMLLRAQGDCYGHLKDWRQAAAAYQQALVAMPEDPDLLSRLGYAAFALGRLDISEQALERALQLGASRPDEVRQLLEQVKRRREADAQ
jgi:tetratricopeptide (TPR) repeat protein